MISKQPLHWKLGNYTRILLSLWALEAHWPLPWAGLQSLPQVNLIHCLQKTHVKMNCICKEKSAPELMLCTASIPEIFAELMNQ